MGGGLGVWGGGGDVCGGVGVTGGGGVLVVGGGGQLLLVLVGLAGGVAHSCWGHTGTCGK